jgi:hypothetical protein
LHCKCTWVLKYDRGLSRVSNLSWPILDSHSALGRHLPLTLFSLKDWCWPVA